MGPRGSPSPAEVMLDATRATLRAGRLPPGEVIKRQLNALADVGYHLEPHLDDDGAELMLGAAKRALRSGHLTPSAVIAHQLQAVSASGHAFVREGDEGGGRCESFEWGPSSFRACARCGLSYWKHPGGVGPVGGAHRRR
ncbi:MAG: hypothetical protein WCB04_01645 [Mycobacteriales bacterium]